MEIKTNVKAGALTQNHNQTAARGMKVKSRVKAGIISVSTPDEPKNHNQTVARGLKARSRVKAGIIIANHNQTAARGLKVKSRVKAGVIDPNV